MTQYINKDALVAEIERRKNICQGVAKANENNEFTHLYYKGKTEAYSEMSEFLDTLEVKDPYEQLIQYPSREDGIKTHAEDYSWNIESELFQQLTPEQQKLWRKEIEQACISGGYCGLNLQKDTRYDDNLEVKEVDLEKEIANQYESNYEDYLTYEEFADIAKHFFELGLKVQKGE